MFVFIILFPRPAIIAIVQTVQLVNNGKHFSRHFYALKNCETRTVFLVVPTLYQKAIIDFTELDRKSRLGVYRFSLQIHRDMVVYLVDKSIQSKAVKYKPAQVVIAGLCGLVANTFIIEYNRSIATSVRVAMRMFWLRVPCETWPVCLHEIRQTLEYDKLLRECRRNLGQLGVLFSSILKNSW